MHTHTGRRARRAQVDAGRVAAARADLLSKAGSYKLVPRKKGVPVVKTRVRCTYKYDPATGALVDQGGHRVRWVGCGYSQIFGVNYWQTYTATAKAAAITSCCDGPFGAMRLALLPS